MMVKQAKTAAEVKGTAKEAEANGAEPDKAEETPAAPPNQVREIRRVF